MRLLKCFVSMAVLCCLSHVGLSQNIYSSPYSVYGLGMLNDRTTSFNRAMGGTGIAIQDQSNLNAVNPASYGAIASPISHIFEAGLYIEANRYTTNTTSDSKTVGGLNDLIYWFKFKPWWSSVVGMAPFSSVAYNIATQKDLGSNVQGNYVYKGSGNITQLYWGNSFSVRKNLSVGAHVSYLFGSIHKNETLQSSSIPSSLSLDHKIFANKIDIDLGLQYRINFEKRALILGAVYDNGVTLNGKSRIALYDGRSDTLNSHDGTRITYKLPQSIGAGLSLQSKRSILAADVKYKQWTKAAFSNQSLTFNDTWRVSLGYSYLGNPRAVSFGDLISIKTGIYMQNYYLNLKGNMLPIWGFSFGGSIPVFDGKSSINLTYSFDQFGTLNDDLILQRSQKIMIDVIIRDLWGIKRKFD
jgi:hypothetical protein